jgi:hypothetical protein
MVPPRVIRATLLCAAALSGCGTIEVSVDVLDPELVRSQADALAPIKSFRDLRAARPGDIAKRVDLAFEAFSREVTRVAASIRDTAQTLPPGRQRDVTDHADDIDFAVGPVGDFRQRKGRVGVDLENLAQRIREVGARSNYAATGPMPVELRALVTDFQAQEKAWGVAQALFARGAKDDLVERVASAAKASASAAATTALAASAPPAAASAAAAAGAARVASAAEPAIREVSARVAAAEAVTSRSIIGDGSLAATEFAYFVASAPDNKWTPEFNRALAKSRLGSSDMVIRLNSTADFSVKGLLFDASKVAQVASKVITQTVLLSAQVAGVPMPTASASAPTGGDALSRSSADLASLDATQAVRDARLASQRAAARSLARSLLAAVPQLKSVDLATKGKDDPGRAAVQGSVSSSFSALSGILSLQDMQ